MGLKMDSALANKIRNLALRFSGKEKSAAEILSLLAEKGLEADEAEIKQLLTLLEEDSAEQPDSSKSKESEQKLLNKINSTAGAWYLLPFELVQFTEKADLGGQILGKGCIRLLFDSASVLKLLNLDCNYKNQKSRPSFFRKRKISCRDIEPAGRKRT